MNHYIPKDDDGTIKLAAETCSFTGPVFVGQGLSKQVGSDCYGYFITSLTKAKNGRPVVGIVHASGEFAHGWTAGDMTCSLPNGKTNPADCKPDEWITISGKHKNGAPKWWYCDSAGKKFNGRKAGFGWNGACAYRDPSF